MSVLLLTFSACLLYTSSKCYKGDWLSRLSDFQGSKKIAQVIGFVLLVLGVVLEASHYDVVTAIINALLAWTLFVSLYILLVPLVRRGQLIILVCTILIACIRQYLLYAS